MPIFKKETGVLPLFDSGFKSPYATGLTLSNYANLFYLLETIINYENF